MNTNITDCPLEYCDALKTLESTVKSEEFWFAIRRLFYADKHSLGTEKDWSAFEKLLNSLKFHCCQDVVVDGKSLACHLDWEPEIYIGHVAMETSRTRVMSRIAKSFTQHQPLIRCPATIISTIIPLLECSPMQIQAFLIENDIPQLPRPGYSPEDSFSDSEDSSSIVSVGHICGISIINIEATPAEPEEIVEKNPNPILARMFWEQAEKNMKTALNMGVQCGNNSVIFMIHQTIELGLKYWLFISNGDDPKYKHHNLYYLALEVSKLKVVDSSLCALILKLETECKLNYSRLRYPNENEAAIPHLLYNPKKCERALEYGTEILDLLNPSQN